MNSSPGSSDSGSRGGVSWQRRAGLFVVTQRGSWTAKLFGLPFFAVGCWMLWQWVSGLLANDLTLAGFVLLAVLGVLFLAPGWVLILGRSRVEIDPTRSEVRSVRDFLVFRLSERTAVRAPLRVTLEWSESDSGPGKPGQHKSPLVTVRLEIEDQRPVTVAFLAQDEEATANELARSLAELLRVPVVDERGA